MSKIGNIILMGLGFISVAILSFIICIVLYSKGYIYKGSRDINEYNTDPIADTSTKYKENITNSDFTSYSVDEILDDFNNNGMYATIDKYSYQYAEITGRVTDNYIQPHIEDNGYNGYIKLNRIKTNHVQGGGAKPMARAYIFCRTNDTSLSEIINNLNRDDIITVQGQISGDPAASFHTGFITLELFSIVNNSKNVNRESGNTYDIADPKQAPAPDVNDYAALSEEDQKRYISDYIGCNPSNLLFFDNGQFDGEAVSRYRYIDNYGEEADFLICIKNDGQIIGYYSDGTVIELKKRFSE